jgi:hypothetical protein
MSEDSILPLNADYVAQLARLETIVDERDRRYEQRFAAQEKAVKDALTGSEKAVAKAEIAAEKRFDSQNEFRAQLADQAGTFIPRLEAEARISALEKSLSIIDNWRSRATGVAAVLILFSGVIGAAIAKAFGG